jgi:predicted Rossmann fold flavoprotein
MRLGIIGGGAAGFFAALSTKEHFPDSEVVIFEKSNKVLSKVKVSGGGRCNVTHACFDNNELAKFYPRGQNQLRKAFEQFNAQSTIDWFKKRNIDLVTLPDNCIFPKSNSSQTIIDCFMNEAINKGVKIQFQTPISKICFVKNSFQISTISDKFELDRLIVTTGGQTKTEQLNWLKELGHEIIEPVPSLFTFNMPENPIRELMGVVVEETKVKIQGTKLLANGPLLITHWGMSGPAILKLSAWGARILNNLNYEFTILVNWLNEAKDFDVLEQIDKFSINNSEKQLITINPFGLSKRLWEFLLNKANIGGETKWKSLSIKGKNKLTNQLINDDYKVKGKTTFKEEFVTAGGVSLNSISFKTMESKVQPGLFFAGEILDIDGITGGFNFQAAWTTAWIAGKNCLK